MAFNRSVIVSVDYTFYQQKTKVLLHPRCNQMKLWDHSCINQVSIDHQSDLYGVSGEGQDVGECTHCNTGSDLMTQNST